MTETAQRYTDLYCFRWPQSDGTTRLGDFFQSKAQVRMCGNCGGPGDPPIVRARVAEIQPGETSSYYAWWDNKRLDFGMVFRSKMMTEVCFTYGSKVEEARGRGHLLNVTVTELPEESA
jgi:hypothetical protein